MHITTNKKRQQNATQQNITIRSHFLTKQHHGIIYYLIANKLLTVNATYTGVGFHLNNPITYMYIKRKRTNLTKQRI